MASANEISVLCLACVARACGDSSMHRLASSPCADQNSFLLFCSCAMVISGKSLSQPTTDAANEPKHTTQQAARGSKTAGRHAQGRISQQSSMHTKLHLVSLCRCIISLSAECMFAVHPSSCTLETGACA